MCRHGLLQHKTPPWRRHTRPSSSAAVEARAVQLKICRRAMNFDFVLYTRGSRHEVVSTYTRVEDNHEDNNSEWIRLGNDMKPLSMEHGQKDEGESGDDNMVAIKSAVLEISLSSVGITTTKLITNGETIVQATKSARNSKLLRWGTIIGIGCVLFIGAFLVKSCVEERIFERDTQRVLAAEGDDKVSVNSFHDGDERQARYLVWKYKGKKDALWRRLKAKYGVQVKHAWEWDDEEEDGAKILMESVRRMR